MAVNYLADTSVLTRLRIPEVRQALRTLVAGTAVSRCSTSDLELGFSARDVKEWDRIRRAVETFALVEITEVEFRRARQVQRALATRHRGRKVPDLLIAAAAERERLTVLHYDRDFEHIAKVTGQPHEWIVHAGSVG
ncbi:MAG TPA: PIN domain nuclease [Mycobacteriales bacterium]|nr:PIN domain nuclease [Mycobacteriales bacterium]